MKKDKELQVEVPEELVFPADIFPAIGLKENNVEKKRIVVKRAYPIFGAMGGGNGMIGRLDEGDIIEVAEEVEGWVRHERGWSFIKDEGGRRKIKDEG